MRIQKNSVSDSPAALGRNLSYITWRSETNKVSICLIQQDNSEKHRWIVDIVFFDLFLIEWWYGILCFGAETW